MNINPWNKAVVYVVDDDEQVRKSIVRLLKAAGYQYESFASAQEFLDAALKQAEACCALLDIRMPGMSGMELQKRMREQYSDIPVIFITGHGDLEKSIDAFRNGAVHFLTKPFNNDQLLSAVREALIKSFEDHSRRQLLITARKGYERLTSREREVFFGVVRGLLNKTIANRIGITETTVKVHRARVMDKMQALSVAQLVRMSVLLANAGIINRNQIELPEG
ncbi:MAG: response regulator [Kiritimatiellia bacterium]